MTKQLRVLMINICSRYGNVPHFPPMPQLQSLALRCGHMTDDDFLEFVDLDQLPQLTDLSVSGPYSLFYDACEGTRLFCGVSASIRTASLERIGDLSILKHFGPSLTQLSLSCCGFDTFDPSISLPELTCLTATSYYPRDCRYVERIRTQLGLERDKDNVGRRMKGHTTNVMRRSSQTAETPFAERTPRLIRK